MVKGTFTAPDGTVSGTEACATNELRIDSVRRGEVPGIHSVVYDSEADSITITHDAHNRKGFALGAVLAAEYTATHEGLLTIDDLFHLHRGGRVSKASAIVGTMIQIKPIIHMDDHGELKVIGKERGRKKALTHIVDMAVKQSEGWDNDIVMITHGDCKEDAEFVARQVEKKMGVHNILINCIGTVIGSHTGPGVVAVFCMGNKR